MYLHHKLLSLFLPIGFNRDLIHPRGEATWEEGDFNVLRNVQVLRELIFVCLNVHRYLSTLVGIV